jgi:hypothetical protein
LCLSLCSLASAMKKQIEEWKAMKRAKGKEPVNGNKDE